MTTLARVLVFVGTILTVLPLVFWFAVRNAVQMAHDTLPSGVEQYATQSSIYLIPAVYVGLAVGVVPLIVGLVLLIRERWSH